MIFSRINNVMIEHATVSLTKIELYEMGNLLLSANRNGGHLCHMGNYQDSTGIPLAMQRQWMLIFGFPFASPLILR